jgi:hypothetical protein
MFDDEQFYQHRKIIIQTYYNLILLNIETKDSLTYLAPNIFQHFPCSLTKLSNFCVIGCANHNQIERFLCHWMCKP